MVESFVWEIRPLSLLSHGWNSRGALADAFVIFAHIDSLKVPPFINIFNKFDLISEGCDLEPFPPRGYNNSAN